MLLPPHGRDIKLPAVVPYVGHSKRETGLRVAKGVKVIEKFINVTSINKSLPHQ